MTVDNKSLVINDSTKIVVISKVTALNTDKAATYEINSYVGTSGAEAVEAYLNGYAVEASFSAINTSSTSGIVQTLYITISSAAANYSLSASNATAITGAGTVTATPSVTVAYVGQTVTVTVTGTNAAATAVTINVKDAAGNTLCTVASPTASGPFSVTGTFTMAAANAGQLTVA